MTDFVLIESVSEAVQPALTVSASFFDVLASSSPIQVIKTGPLTLLLIHCERVSLIYDIIDNLCKQTIWTDVGQWNVKTPAYVWRCVDSYNFVDSGLLEHFW